MVEAKGKADSDVDVVGLIKFLDNGERKASVQRKGEITRKEKQKEMKKGTEKL